MEVSVNYLAILPEIIVLTMTCIALLVDVFFCKDDHTITYVVVQIALIIAALVTLSQFSFADTTTLNNSFTFDRFGNLLKLFIYVASFASFLYSRSYIIDRNFREGEFYVLGLFSVLGMMIMVSAYNFITLYLGLELSSLPLYAMIAMQRKSP